ncbi:MAG: VOC family protein [Chloroflexi bacterium]|nr:VOC family protein [Chloroflexota bacterium]
MPETRVTGVRHIGLAVPAYDQQVEFYEKLWGLKKIDHDTDVAFFAAEGSPEQYIFRLRKSQDRRVDLVALSVADAAAVDTLAADLARDGVPIVSEPGRLQTPGDGYGFRCFDPDGRVVEISADVARRPFRVLEYRESIPQKLSHVVFYTPDPATTVAFYRDKLGLLVSGWIGDFFGFLRAERQPDFHILAFARGPASYFHASFELRGYDEYMRGCGRALEADVPLLWGLGKHVPADSAFAYFQDPNGLVCEYSPPQEQILDGQCYVPTQWGPTENPGDIWGTARSQNLPEAVPPGTRPGPTDPGLWLAPPV